MSPARRHDASLLRGSRRCDAPAVVFVDGGPTGEPIDLKLLPWNWPTPRKRRSSFLLGNTGAILSLLTALSAAIPAYGQHPDVGKDLVVPLSRYVPQDVAFFLRIPRPADADAALKRTGALSRVEFSGAGGSKLGSRADLKELAADFLGPDSSVDVDQLMNCEIGIIAEGWSDLSRAVWLVRLKDPTVLDHWVPPASRLHDLQSRMGIRYIWTRDGMTLCIRDDVVALARRVVGGSLLKKVRAMMNGRGGRALEKSETLQKLEERLPARYLAILCLADQDDSDQGGDAAPLFWPEMDRTAVALYERKGRLVMALSAQLAKPRLRPSASPQALERLGRLPRTTLLAVATTFDFARAYQDTLVASEPGILSRYLALMEGLGSRRSAAAEIFQGIGPNVILVWGQNLGGDARVPDLAVMVECKDAKRIRAEFTYMVGSILKMLGAVDPVQRGSAPVVKLEMHLGCPVLSIRLAEYAGESRFPLSRMLAGAEPSWAAAGNWFAFALDRNHLKRILDAQNGLVPGLDSIRDVQILTRRRETRMTLAVIQAGLAADVLSDWLNRQASLALPFLDSLRGRTTEATGSNSLERLGLAVRLDESKRVPTVTTVFPGSPADGRMKPEDQILGVDGALLDLKAPAVDLRRKLSQCSAQSGPTFRVQRGESVVDVVIPTNGFESGLTGLLVNPVDAIRDLTALGSALNFVTVETRLSDETHLSARLSLQFTDSEQAQR